MTRQLGVRLKQHAGNVKIFLKYFKILVTVLIMFIHVFNLEILVIYLQKYHVIIEVLLIISFIFVSILWSN